MPEELEELEIDDSDGVETDPPEPEPTKEPADQGKVAEVYPAEHARLKPDLNAQTAVAKVERARAKEADTAARYWNEQAKAGGGKKPEAAPEPEDDIDLVDVITKDGIKGLDRALAKLGYAKQADVKAEIGATRAQISTEAAVLAKYPDLSDNGSPLFKKTAEIFNQLRQDPDMAKSPRLMEIAARTATAELAIRGDGA